MNYLLLQTKFFRNILVKIVPNINLHSYEIPLTLQFVFDIFPTLFTSR